MLTVRHLGMKYICGAGHVEFLPWNKEARAALKQGDESWKGCKDCSRITYGQPYGLMSVLETQ